MRRLSTITALCIVFLSPILALGQEIRPDRTYPKFAVGSTGIYATIEPGFAVTVQEIAAESPAAGHLQTGDVIVTAGEYSTSVADPRVRLGNAITDAEATGELPLVIRRGDRTQAVSLTLPKLGPYSKTWPRNCPKSDAIIRQTAEYIIDAQQADGAYSFDGQKVKNDLKGCLASLFLLSTGDDEHLPSVRLHARAVAAEAVKNPTGSSWQLGYQGILLAEYYLRTGDREVIPALESLCAKAISMQAAGAWGHGSEVNPGYVQSGLMNSAGVPVLATLILARECGANVDEAGFIRSLEFFYRMVGHGNVCYGDHRSELWWPNTNGRNAMMACTLVLLDEPRYQLAARHLALLVADSYYKPEFGHTGGGFNVIWRGIGSSLVPENRSLNYRRQLDELSWYYDLCRQPGGGFSILPTPPDNTFYCGLPWGTGAVGLTYTAPRRKLRITGAPRTKYSVQYVAPNMDWGTDSDLIFLSTADAEGFRETGHNPREVYELLIGGKKNEATVGFCANQMRSYSPMVRTWAARWLNEHPSDAATDAIESAVNHGDPRVRRAGYDAISGYDNWSSPRGGPIERSVVSARFVPAIRRALHNPDSAWWEIDGALFALGQALPEDIRGEQEAIRRFAHHNEWYLRQAAFWALDGLRESMTPEEFERLADIYADESRVFARASFDSGFKIVVKQKEFLLPEETLKAVAEVLGPTLHSANTADGYDHGAALHEAAHRTMMITTQFEPKVYHYMVSDLTQYLDVWTPYYQHSCWMITGNKWQPGLIKIMNDWGEDARPIYQKMKTLADGFDKFDKRRNYRGAEELKNAMQAAVAAWEQKYGASKP